MRCLGLILILSIMTACNSPKSKSSSGSPNLTPDFSKLIPSCFSAYSTSSIITTGDFSAALGLTKTTWNDPHVIKVGSQFWMYASSDDNFNGNIKIYRLISNDGINWNADPTTPVLQRSAGQFDSVSTETPAVVYFNNQYHMFWTGYSNSGDVGTFAIGHAVSNDGINFTKDAGAIVTPTLPYGAANLDFNQFLVAEPGPVVFNNQIYLYFTALGANAGVSTTLQVIGLTRSSDGVTWSAPVEVLQPNQAQYPRATYKGFSTPHAIALNGKVHLFYDVFEDTISKQVRLHHAVSDNGVSGWTQDSTAIYDRSAFVWTADEIRSPAAYLNGTNLMFWFAGNSNVNDLGIGYSPCDLSP